MNNDKLRKMIMSKSFSSRKSDEKAFILDTYVENCVKLSKNENQENERKYKKFIIKAIIVSITIIFTIVGLIIFCFNPSDSVAKAFEVYFAAIPKLLRFLLE